MTQNTDLNIALFERAKDVIPGGVNSPVRAFAAGVLDVPFAPAMCNAGKLMPVRDNEGAVRIFEVGRVPLPDDVLAYHKEKIAERAKAENRAPVFQMVVDDIYAISKSKLIGRPR